MLLYFYSYMYLYFFHLRCIRYPDEMQKTLPYQTSSSANFFVSNNLSSSFLLNWIDVGPRNYVSAARLQCNSISINLEIPNEKYIGLQLFEICPRSSLMCFFRLRSQSFLERKRGSSLLPFPRRLAQRRHTARSRRKVEKCRTTTSPV